MEGILSVVLSALAFFLFFYAFYSIVKAANKRQQKDLQSYLEKEQEANLARVKDIPEELFLKPNINNLPFIDYKENNENRSIIRLQEEVIRNSEKPMLQFDSELSNIDLKYQYGSANIELIAMYEQSYQRYVYSLDSWAKELIEENNLKDAQIILEEAIDMEPLIYSVYENLVNIYNNNNEEEKIIKLKDKVSKMKIVNDNEYLKERLDELLNI